MYPLLTGLILGILLGVAYLFSKEPAVRRTLASSVLLGVAVGILVELARRPLFSAIFSGLATVFLVGFFQWVRRGLRKRS